MKNNLLPVAKEGWKFVFYSALAFVIFSVLDLEFLGFLAFLTTLMFVFVYRNPERDVPTFQEASVVSPVDGVVLSIEELEDDEYAYKVQIEGSYLDVAVLRAPFSSLVEEFNITRGTKLPKFNPLAYKLNENATIIFKDTANNKIKISHRLKQSFDEIKIDIFKEQKFQQGSRYGVMVDGVTTIYLPQNFRLNISVGNQVKASESLIGYFS